MGNPYWENSGVWGSLLKNRDWLILDGAMGTQLEARGADLKNGLWSASLLKTHPDLIKAVHKDYLRAGACIITSSGYQASLMAFMKNGFTQEEGIGLIHTSVDLALEARKEMVEEGIISEPFPLVAISLGPYGAYLADGSEYHGKYGVSYQELVQFHHLGISLVCDSGADILAFETIPSLEEAKAIVEALEFFKKTKAWISFSCRNETEVSHGESIKSCVKIIEKSSQILGIGINCTAPEYMESLVRIAANATQKPILAYPNKGDQYDADKKEWKEGSSHLSFREGAEIWLKAGAKIIGGCCGTTPENIKELVL